MNFGAKIAKTSLLYFVHVDSKLPQNFDAVILSSFKEKKVKG